jgi:hypothetical protein
LEFPADQALERLEELLGENECRMLLLFGFGGSDHVVRSAVTLGDWNHAILIAQDASFRAPDLIQPAATKFDAVVFDGRGSPI